MLELLVRWPAVAAILDAEPVILGDSGVLQGAVARALDIARDRLFTTREGA